MHSSKRKILTQNLKQIAICPCPLDSVVNNLSLTNSKQAISGRERGEKEARESNAWSSFSFPSLFDYFEVPGFFWSSDCGKLSKYRGSTARESFAVPIILL